RLGGMDDTGYLYHDDVNLSWILHLAGFDTYCIPEAMVYHDYRLSMYPAKLHLLERNRMAMRLAYLRPTSPASMSPLLALPETLMWGYCLLKGWGFLKAKA